MEEKKVPEIVQPDQLRTLQLLGKTQFPSVLDNKSALSQFLEDENLRDRISQQCLTIALQEYTLELQAQRYIELYRQLLQK